MIWSSHYDERFRLLNRTLHHLWEYSHEEDNFYYAKKRRIIIKFDINLVNAAYIELPYFSN